MNDSENGIPGNGEPDSPNDEDGTDVVIVVTSKIFSKVIFRECYGSDTPWPIKNPERSDIKTRLSRELLDFSCLTASKFLSP